MVIAALLTGFIIGIMIGIICGMFLEDSLDLIKFKDKIRKI